MDEYADMDAVLDLMKTPEGISPVEKLLNEFEAHESKEEQSLEQYRKMFDHISSPLSRFLLQLIISDEERHRATIHAMAVTLRGSLTWKRPPGSLEENAESTTMLDKLRDVTDEFIQLEKDGIREYKVLEKESSGYYHGLFKVLLDSMIRDSEKHVQLLEFLKESFKR